jgi:hypothetical protein
MGDDHLVDIADKLNRPRVLRDFTKNPSAPQCYDQHVAWITQQYELATYLRGVDSCLASTMSTKGDSPLSRFALIDSPLDKSSWDDCLTCAEIERCLMVTFVTSNKTVMVDHTDNEIEYIKTNPLNLEQTSTIRVKQEDEDIETSGIDLLDSSEEETSGDELDDMEQEEEGEGNEELPGMPEDQDDSDPGIMPITNIALPSNSPGRTAEQEDQDFAIQNAEELHRVDADFNKIALTELEGANDPDGQAQKQDQTDNVDVDWLVTALVRVVAVRSVELLSALSRCQRCCQSCCQSSAAVRAAVRATVRAAVIAVVRAQPLSEPLSKLLSELSPVSE